MPKPEPELRQAACLRWERGEDALAIRESLNVEFGRTVTRECILRWARDEEWKRPTQAGAPAAESREAVDAELQRLLRIPTRTSDQDKLVAQLGKMSIRYEELRVQALGAQAKRVQPLGDRAGRSGKRPASNDLIEETGRLRDLEHWRPWQRRFMADESRERYLRKSRQIGGTEVMAGEMFDDGMDTGNDQVCISASERQCQIVRRRVVKLVDEAFGVRLRGTEQLDIRGPNGWFTIYFLSSNANTAQGYTGNLWLDEVEHMTGLEELLRLAKPIMVLGSYRLTMASSAGFSDSYANRLYEGRDDAGKKVKDSISRHLVTLRQAIREGGIDVTWARIKLEYPHKVIRDNLFLCKPIDSASAFFGEALLRSGALPAAPKWGGGETVLGVDSSRSKTGDNSVCIVIEPYKRDGEMVYRVVHHELKRGTSYRSQGRWVADLAAKFCVTRILIDTTGKNMGQAVFEEFDRLLPPGVIVRCLQYTPELKTEMAIKTRRLFEEQRIEYHVEDDQLTRSLRAVSLVSTENGRTTVHTRRTAKAGHGDSAHALFHALRDVDMGGRGRRRRRSGRTRSTIRIHNLSKAA